jgi:hypothetical protein
MHKDKSLMVSIQLFSNNKTPFTLEGHNFLIWAQNQVLYMPSNVKLKIKCYTGPSNVMVEGASKLFEDLLQKMHGY